MLYSLCHELVHLDQVVRGDFGMDDDQNILWKNQIYDPNKYKKGHDQRKKDQSDYRETPWEKEAYDKEKNLFKSLMDSKEFKEIFDRWDVIVKDLSNNNFEIRDILRSGFVEPTFLGQAHDKTSLIG